MMFIAGRKSVEFCASSLVRTDAQSRAEIESPRARVPYMAGCEFTSATVLRTTALQLKRSRFLAAYGHRHTTQRALRPFNKNQVPGLLHRANRRPRITARRRSSPSDHTPSCLTHCGLASNSMRQVSMLGKRDRSQYNGNAEPTKTVS